MIFIKNAEIKFKNFLLFIKFIVLLNLTKPIIYNITIKT